jgi:hypothetical protein
VKDEGTRGKAELYLVARLHHNLNRRLYNHHWSADLQLGDAGHNSPDRAIFDTSYIEMHGYVLLVNRQLDCLPVRISTYLLFSRRSEHLSPVFDRKDMSIIQWCYHDCFYRRAFDINHPKLIILQHNRNTSLQGHAEANFDSFLVFECEGSSST